MSNTTFIDDMSSRRARARRYMISCSASQDEEQSKHAIIDLLNEALATALICAMRYKAHYFASHGFAAPGDDIKLADSEFLLHVEEEQGHVEKIAARITELGGHADYNPPVLGQRGYSDYTSTASLLDMLQEDLIGERIAMDIYREMIRFVSVRDVTTRDLLQEIVAQEQEYVDRLSARIESLRPEPVRRAVA